MELAGGGSFIEPIRPMVAFILPFCKCDDFVRLIDGGRSNTDQVFGVRI